MEEGSETNEGGRRRKRAKGEEMKEKCIGISIISHISGNEANAVVCWSYKQLPRGYNKQQEKVSIQPRRRHGCRGASEQHCFMTGSPSLSACGVSWSRNRDLCKNMLLSYTPGLYVLFTTEQTVHMRPVVMQHMQHSQLCVEEQTTARRKQEDACCAGPARNRRSGPHLPGEEGTAAGSMAPPCDSVAQQARDLFLILFFLLCDTQIQMCITEGKCPICRLDKKERGLGHGCEIWFI